MKLKIAILVIVASTIVLATRPIGFNAKIIFLLVGLILCIAGMLFGGNFKKPYKPVFIFIALLSVAATSAGIYIYAADAKECADFISLCVSKDIVFGMLMFILASLSVFYLVGFMLPGVVIGKRFTAKK